MKFAIVRWGLVVLMGFFMTGCSSIRARTEMSDKDWTVYPGIRQNVKDTGALFSSQSPDPIWIKGMMTTIYIVDMPFSAVFDTVVMPYDIYRINTPKESGK